MAKENKPREYTKEEVRKQFIGYVNDCINYWEREERTPDVRCKLEGLAHSILVGIDGEAAAPISLPQFILAPNPHPDDKNYSISQGKNYYPENYSEVKYDISGGLHEILHDCQIEE